MSSDVSKLTVGESPLQHYLNFLYEKYRHLNDGEVADYIPELAKANPDWFGITLVTVDGHVYQVGDTHEDFTIQSISKVISYGMALQDHGVDRVLSKVGVEPSGDAFNSISLDPETGRPRNPMINAGAIATTGLIDSKDGTPPLDRLLKTMEHYVGHKVGINEAVCNSESETGHRNRAIGFMLRNFEILEEDPSPTLELYFQQCSMNVNCRDLALLAATFANNGINPITGLIALEAPYVHKVLSVMGSCGMYNYSGNWLFKVGMPAKSGVGGGIIAVLPGQFGLAVFSPRLDELGNSVRGIKVCEEISREFGLHLYHSASSTSASVIRLKYDGTMTSSRKKRNHLEEEMLARVGHKITGYELQGNLMFGATESLILDIMHETSLDTDFIIIELIRIVDIDEASSKLFSEAISILQRQGKQIFFTDKQDKYKFVRYLEKNNGKEVSQKIFQFNDRDHALEWCEEQLIPDSIKTDVFKVHELEDHFICEGLTPEELDNMQNIAFEKQYQPGEMILMQDDKADSMFFIVSGEVEIIMKLDHKREKRLNTLTPGLTFGELAMLNRNKRTASVRALTVTRCYEVLFDDIPADIRFKMMANLSNILATKLAMDSKEMTIMS